jgi:hypothetical protein
VASRLQWRGDGGIPRHVERSLAMSRIANTAAFLLACSALALPALASHSTVQTVKIAVVDPRTNQELATLDPGDTLELPANVERLLRLFEPPRTDRRERRYLPAEFGFGPQQTALEVVRRTQGGAVIRLRPGGGTTMRSGNLHVGFKIADEVVLADEAMRLGRVLVEVEPASNRRADDIVNALYRGILLRDPDAGAASRRQEIARDGHPAVLRHAREIAASRESEIDLYQKGICNQQRLLALYEHLLGRQAPQINQRTWRDQLQHLERGDIAEVVNDLVTSREFQERFDLRSGG